MKKNFHETIGQSKSLLLLFNITYTRNTDLIQFIYFYNSIIDIPISQEISIGKSSEAIFRKIYKRKMKVNTYLYIHIFHLTLLILILN